MEPLPTWKTYCSAPDWSVTRQIPHTTSPRAPPRKAEGRVPSPSSLQGALGDLAACPSPSGILGPLLCHEAPLPWLLWLSALPLLSPPPSDGAPLVSASPPPSLPRPSLLGWLAPPSPGPTTKVAHYPQACDFAPYLCRPLSLRWVLVTPSLILPASLLNPLRAILPSRRF